ncbi:MAG: hypothetical protein QM761_13050 [Pseudoxanthomonas sp.]
MRDGSADAARVVAVASGSRKSLRKSAFRGVVRREIGKVRERFRQPRFIPWKPIRVRLRHEPPRVRAPRLFQRHARNLREKRAFLFAARAIAKAMARDADRRSRSFAILGVGG